jgi:hypothetical protein
MPFKYIAVIVVVLIAGAFLAGYVPQQRLRSSAEQQSRTLGEQLETSEARVRMAGLLGQLLAIEEVVMRQNYGQAQELASRFFDDVGKEAASTPMNEFQSVLRDVLSRRDSVTALLTKADPAVLGLLQAIEEQIRRGLGYPVPQNSAAGRSSFPERGVVHGDVMNLRALQAIHEGVHQVQVLRPAPPRLLQEA